MGKKATMPGSVIDKMKAAGADFKATQCKGRASGDDAAKCWRVMMSNRTQVQSWMPNRTQVQS